MAQQRRTDLLGRLVDAGEDAIQRLSDVPGGERVVTAVNAMRDRVDELQRRVRGLEDLDRRLSALERKVDKLSRGGTAARTRKTDTSSKKS
jgi:prophage DNA circulation protein